MSEKKSTEVEIIDAPMLSKAGLDSTVWDEDAVKALIAESGLTAEDVVFLGDAFPIVDKNELVGVPLMFIQWQFGDSQNYGTEYVQVKAIRLDKGEPVGIFDSGTGIRAQLSEVTDARFRWNRENPDSKQKAPFNALHVEKGLTRSDYAAHTNKLGVTVPAGTTYYLG